MGVRAVIIAGKSDSAEDFRLASCGMWVPSSAINTRTGVTSTPVLTSTGAFTCTVGPFNCVIDGTSNSLQGAYPVALDTATTVTINAANTQARIDLISLQIQDNAYDGSGQNRGQILYTAGTPGSGVAPSAPANSISLWTVPVAANASSVNFASATAVFPYTAAAGGIVPARSAADKPAVVSAVQYRHRLDVAAGSGASPLEWSTDGVTYTPSYDPNAAYGAWTNCTVNTPTFSISNQPQYRTAPGGRIELRGYVLLPSGNTVPSGVTNFIGNLPSPAAFRAMPIANLAGNVLFSLNSGNTTAVIQAGSSLSGPLGFGLDGLSYTL